MNYNFWHLRKEINIFLAIFLGMVFLSFWLLNGGALAKEIRYRLVLSSPLASEDLKNNEILSLKKSAFSSPVASIRKSYKLVIPKISVVSPVIFPKKNTTTDILASLEEGVGLYPGSVSPGENGRTIILGHSSRASWYRGEYATIFSLLGKLEEGDTFYIIDGDKKYFYEVFSKKFLTPSETNTILAGKVNESEIDLITCWPSGSASKRTLVQAKLVDIGKL